MTIRTSVGSVMTFTGAALGGVAGVAQACYGSQIPDWSGAKAEPAALGILTVALCCLATIAAIVVLHGPDRPTVRVAMLTTVLVLALVCFSSVGRLWLIPGPLLLVGATLQLPGATVVWQVLRSEWVPALVVALGASELLMAAGATRPAMVVGAVGGAALVASAGLSRSHPRLSAVLLVLGTVPFAAAAWTALVPVLVLVLVAALAVPLLRRSATATA